MLKFSAGALAATDFIVIFATKRMEMRNQIPPDLLEAKSLFEMSLDQTEHWKRLAYFEDALDAIEDFLSDFPETPYNNFIDNIRLTYTKKLIDGLSSIRESDIDVKLFIKYLTTIEHKMSREFQVICKNHPELEEEYKSYLDFFRGFIPEKEY